MRKYMKPIMDLLLFDEDEVLTSSTIETYSTAEMADVLTREKGVKRTTVITIEKVAIN